MMFNGGGRLQKKKKRGENSYPCEPMYPRTNLCGIPAVLRGLVTTWVRRPFPSRCTRDGREIVTALFDMRVAGFGRTRRGRCPKRIHRAVRTRTD